MCKQREFFNPPLLADVISTVIEFQAMVMNNMVGISKAMIIVDTVKHQAEVRILSIFYKMTKLRYGL